MKYSVIYLQYTGWDTDMPVYFPIQGTSNTGNKCTSQQEKSTQVIESKLGMEQ